MTSRQSLQVAVVMERIAAPNHWEDWQFRVVDVVPDEGVFGAAPRRLVDDGKVSRWLYPGFTVELFPDECKGYYLNLTSGRPSWFVSWVVDADPSLPTLTGVSVSYVEADRRMASEERVETVALEPELCEWLRLFTNAHYRPEVRRKVRAMSFLSPEERERQMARIEPGPATPPPETEAQARERERNAALRAMFHSDPHFRQSDGLDVGVDEVFEIEGSPSGRQRKIERARALGLLDDELLDQELPAAGPPAAAGTSEPGGGQQR
ncbi:MAG: DUF3305 domain-containing protein [Gammaproteobacteria bacterium]|uniref:DUF3305 domain-containing protein n=1 Tax=Azohydromonas sp. TaxID=1872666 RepID=UPI002BADB1F6|nr:DUF3305 domain-containing protein [Azohydromonas sp.]HMM84235.1 DUF3305 domain-containing protein [Azohydromonas sp.]